MKFLFDENLSRKLVQRLADLFPGSAHVVGVDLMKSPDREIWDFAKANEFIVGARISISTTWRRLWDRPRK